jgi:hypothetical protein
MDFITLNFNVLVVYLDVCNAMIKYNAKSVKKGIFFNKLIQRYALNK